jgi:hypothetical protein
MKRLLFAIVFVLLAAVRLCAVELSTATVTLTDAQIKALPTTPVEIVAAPGSGHANLVSKYVLKFDNRGGGYDGRGYASMSLIPLLNEGGGIESELTLELAPAPGLYATDIHPRGSYDPENRIYGWLDYGQLNNKAVTIQGYSNDNGDFDGGDPANSLTVVVYYLTVDL